MHKMTSSLLFVPCIALLVTACPGDDAPADTEATAGSSTGSSTSTTGSDPDPDSSSSGSASASSSGPEDPSTSVADPSTSSTTGDGSTDDTTTGDPPAFNTCLGYTYAGNLDGVYSRDGAPIDPACNPAPAPCGGDPVGSWVLESTCGYEAVPNLFGSECPGATFALAVSSSVGTLSFADDGTFSRSLEIEAELLFELDTLACFGVACDEFEALVQMDDPAAVCVEVGPGCACTLPDPGLAEELLGPSEELGTYTVVGTDLALETFNGPSVVPFCVAGDRLDVWPVLYDGPVLTDQACVDVQDCIDALGDEYDVYECEYVPRPV